MHSHEDWRDLAAFGLLNIATSGTQSGTDAPAHDGDSLGKYDLEREVVIAEKRLARVFQELVRTRESQEEGGLRSCLRPLGEAETQRGHHGNALALTLLYQASNMLAHQNLTNLALYLGLLSRVVRRLLDNPDLMVVYERDRLERMGADREARLRKEADLVLNTIDGNLSRNFPALNTDVRDPKDSMKDHQGSSPSSSPPGSPPPASAGDLKSLGEGMSKVTLS